MNLSKVKSQMSQVKSIAASAVKGMVRMVFLERPLQLFTHSNPSVLCNGITLFAFEEFG